MKYAMVLSTIFGRTAENLKPIIEEMIAQDAGYFWAGCYTSPVKAKNTRPKHVEVPNPAGKAGIPVSLYPLSFDEAMTGLAQTKIPESEKKSPKRKENPRRDQ